MPLVQVIPPFRAHKRMEVCNTRIEVLLMRNTISMPLCALMDFMLCIRLNNNNENYYQEFRRKLWIIAIICSVQWKLNCLPAILQSFCSSVFDLVFRNLFSGLLNPILNCWMKMIADFQVCSQVIQRKGRFSISLIMHIHHKFIF